jgi:CO/xanthine dehydrogenase FAD-binding subunit
MAVWQNYLQPQSIPEALQGLGAAPGTVRIIAGGTDLLLDIQQGRHPPVDTLVDVTGIPELRQVQVTPDGIYIGSAVTHFEILQHPVLNQEARGLVDACGLIGGPQVRNVATLGGNVAHALPAGDGIVALLALAAEVQVAGLDGTRWQPIGELFKSPGQTVLDPRCELIVGFRLPRSGPGESSAFERVMRPQGVAIAILNMGAWLRLAADGTVADLRLAVGPAGPLPFRAHATEASLRGRQLEAETLAVAAEVLAGEAQLRTSPHRATAEYRRHLLPVVLNRVLETAQSRAR